MTVKDLIVHLDRSDAGKARMEYAFALAEAHGAHLAGVGYAPVGTVPYYGAPDLFMPIPLEYFERLRAEAREALDAFAAAGERRGLAVETRLVECGGIDFPYELAHHARHADLTVVGQPDREHRGGSQHALIEELLFASGRPVLMVPWAGTHTATPRTVTVAWDASGPAARAVSDALPFLRAARKVVVLVIDGTGDGAHGDVPGADISLHLARHGVTVEAHRVPGGGDIGVADLLLSQLADSGAEMLVMGGYHHSRLRQFVLGGVTRAVLESMTVPVLMAH